MKILLYIVLLACVAMPFEVYGQRDTTVLDEEVWDTGFDKNLDSLMQLWYVRNAVTPDSLKLPVALENDIIIPEYPDSVYIERLSRIPSVLPLTYNNIVRNYIHVYTKKRRDRLEVMLGLADYYFPVFEEIFDFYGLPPELKYLAVIESALNPRAVSRVGATGIWQFMFGTAKAYGLTVNSIVDERRDPVKSTHAAARYLRDLHNIYNDWTLVIAAYNCGPGNVNKAIRRSGRKKSYWDLYYYLPRETRGYVPAYIAATYAMNYYDEHNLSPRSISLPLAADTIMINDNLHLKQVSEVLQVPVKLLRDMNPQYKRDIIPGKSRSFALKIPVNHTLDFISLQDSIFAYKDSIFFNPSNTIINPTRSRYVPQAPTGRTKLYYTVKSGDTPGHISEWYRVGLSDLRYWNGIRNIIRVGRKLVVYVPPSKAKKYRKINSMTFSEKQRSIGKSVPVQAKVQTDNSIPDDQDYVYYKVRYGDSIWEIARKFPGVTQTEILQLNQMSSSDKIHPGQRLKIKRKS
jgi:membrane-bound lytic murein transglycosylase D